MILLFLSTTLSIALHSSIDSEVSEKKSVHDPKGFNDDSVILGFGKDDDLLENYFEKDVYNPGVIPDRAFFPEDTSCPIRLSDFVNVDFDPHYGTLSSVFYKEVEVNILNIKEYDTIHKIKEFLRNFQNNVVFTDLPCIGQQYMFLDRFSNVYGKDKVSNDVIRAEEIPKLEEKAAIIYNTYQSQGKVLKDKSTKKKANLEQIQGELNQLYRTFEIEYREIVEQVRDVVYVTEDFESWFASPYGPSAAIMWQLFYALHAMHADNLRQPLTSTNIWDQKGDVLLLLGIWLSSVFTYMDPAVMGKIGGIEIMEFLTGNALGLTNDTRKKSTSINKLFITETPKSSIHRQSIFSRYKSQSNMSQRSSKLTDMSGRSLISPLSSRLPTRNGVMASPLLRMKPSEKLEEDIVLSPFNVLLNNVLIYVCRVSFSYKLHIEPLSLVGQDETCDQYNQHQLYVIMEAFYEEVMSKTVGHVFTVELR